MGAHGGFPAVKPRLFTAEHAENAEIAAAEGFFFIFLEILARGNPRAFSMFSPQC
jgi:hypothetical protein